MASPTESDMADADLRRKLKQLVQQAFALPGVQQAVWDVEAQELCQQIDAWLAAVEEERNANAG